MPGITAKILGQRAGLSTYAALTYAMKLVKLKLLTYKEAVSAEAEGKIIYSFYPALGLIGLEDYLTISSHFW